MFCELDKEEEAVVIAVVRVGFRKHLRRSDPRREGAISEEVPRRCLSFTSGLHLPNGYRLDPLHRLHPLIEPQPQKHHMHRYHPLSHWFRQVAGGLVEN